MPDKSFAIRLILIILAVVILFVLITQYNKKNKASVLSEDHLEKFDSTMPSSGSPPSQVNQINQPNQASMSAPTTNVVKPSEEESNEDFKAIDFNSESNLPGDCFPRKKTTVEDLLPKDAANTTWAQVNPAGQGELKDQNFLTAGFHVGINTVGQTMRNPNLQIRSEPPNPRVQVSPWNQSTVEYDTSRRYFEVGEC